MWTSKPFHEDLKSSLVWCHLKRINSTRRDRALILYNHIWASDQVDAQARKLLATDRGYLDIIDHEYFNPRVIEYITGFASLELSSQDNASFIDFARAALDDPSLVWRQAFDNQLSAAERAIVVVAATLPARFDLATLDAGVHAYAKAMGMRLSGSDVQAAIKSVGESFLKSTPIASTPTFTLVNPSLEDFVARWLVERTPERQAAIDGAIAFEQLIWLRNYALQDASRHVSETSLAKFEVALLRLWTASPLGIAVNIEGQTQTAWHAPSLDPIERVRFARSHAMQFVATSTLKSEIDLQIEAIVKKWRERKSLNFDASRKLLDEMIEDGSADSNALEAFKEFSYSAYWPRDWGVALEFAEAHSEMYTEDEKEELEADFDAAFNASIEAADDADSTMDLEEYYDVAEKHEREIDHEAYYEAINAIEEGISQREPDFDDDDRHADRFDYEDSGSLGELDALFGRLAES